MSPANIKPNLKKSRFLVVGTFLLLLIAILNFERVGRMVGTCEQWIAPSLLLVSGFLWFSSKLNRKSASVWPSRIRYWLETHLLEFCLFISLLPLVAAWSGSFVQWSTMYASLLGRIPWSDALGYYSGASQFLDEGGLNEWTSRRPLNTLFLAFRYSFTGEWLEGALILQSCLAGAGLYIATRSVWKVFGVVGAFFFLSLAYGFHRIFAPTTLSESLAMTVGLFALPLLLDGVYRREVRSFVMAALVLALGQVLRPGAIFILPALAVCAVFFWRPRLKQGLVVLLATCFAITIPFFANKAALRYAPLDVVPSLNLLWTLHGLTIGSDWVGGEESVGRIIPRKGESKRNAVLRVSIENIKNDPAVFLRTLAYNTAYSLVRVPLEVGNSLFSVAVRKDGFGWKAVAGGVGCILLFMPFLIEFCARIKSRDLPYGLFWIVVVLAMVVAFPIIIRDGSFRVLAGNYSLFLAAGAAVLAGKKIRIEPLEGGYWICTLSASFVLIIPVVLSPALLLLHKNIPIVDRADSELIAIRSEVTAVAVVEKKKITPSIYQTIAHRRSFWEIDDFRHVVEASKCEMVEEVKTLDPPFTMAIVLDAYTGQRDYLLFDGIVGTFEEGAYRFKLGGKIGRWKWVESHEPVLLPKRSE